MNFLVDAQLPPALCKWLADQGHDAVHITDLLPGETPDAQIAELAFDQKLVILTKDDDFALRHRRDGLCIVWLRVGNATNRALSAWLTPRWPFIEHALTEGEQVIEVR